jgi:hypothetical protein
MTRFPPAREAAGGLHELPVCPKATQTRLDHDGYAGLAWLTWVRLLSGAECPIQDPRGGGRISQQDRSSAQNIADPGRAPGRGMDNVRLSARRSGTGAADVFLHEGKLAHQVGQRRSLTRQAVYG